MPTEFSARGFTFGLLAIAGLFALAGAAGAQIKQAQLAPGYEEGLSPKLNYETVGRLLLSVARDGGQLRVTNIDNNSPALRMKSPNDPNEVASLETGDFIRAVDGQRVDNVQSLQALLGAGAGEHRIEVVDHRTQQAFDWLVEPQLTQRPQIRAALGSGRQRKVHVIIAGLTEDPEIGSGISFSVEELDRTLRGEIGAELIEITKLTGDQCRTNNILDTILTLPTESQDSLFVYYLGHGAFDPKFENDVSRGHFFQLPGGDLLRRVMWDQMQATPARTRMLITDTCNIESSASPSKKYASELRVATRQQVGPTKWEWLLLGHSGTLDIGATDRQQRAWFSSDIGGWFSKSFLHSCSVSGNGQWPKVFQELPNETQQTFLAKRQEFLNNPGKTKPETIANLRQQQKMTPLIRNNLVRDQIPPVDVNAVRTMQREYSAQVPINN